jgi:putative transcriptional regulator
VKHVIEYKIDILKALKDKGFSAARCRKEKILPESTMQRLRHGKPVGLDAINTICIILDCQPSDIINVTSTIEELDRFGL